MDYIDNSKQATNVVGLVSRSTMRTQAIFSLKKTEIANSAYCVTGLKDGAKEYLLIGTAFLNPEETIPSQGRLLMLHPTTMQLI